jgi:hypothetical protein
MTHIAARAYVYSGDEQAFAEHLVEDSGVPLEEASKIVGEFGRFLEKRCPRGCEMAPGQAADAPEEHLDLRERRVLRQLSEAIRRVRAGTEEGCPKTFLGVGTRLSWIFEDPRRDEEIPYDSMLERFRAAS